MSTKIEWTHEAERKGETWNPIRARRRNAGGTVPAGKTGHYCQKISPGCKNCYAESMNLWRGNGVGYTVPELAEVEIYLDEDVLFQPMRWRAPRSIFVCSMTDLFADFVPLAWIERVYAVMAMCGRHTFMVLTKRPDRRRAFLTEQPDAHAWAERLSALADGVNPCFHEDADCHIANAINGVLAEGFNVGWPMRNVREGVTVCNQDEANRLIPLLLQTPAAVRFLSCEPLLGPIDFSIIPRPEEFHRSPYGWHQWWPKKLHWVICGGESGHGARPMHPDWARSLRDQCQAAAVPFFFKQWGEWAHGSKFSAKARIVLNDGRVFAHPDEADRETLNRWNEFAPEYMCPVGKKAAGAVLDGVEHKAFPGDL